MARACAPALKANKGAVVNVSSVASLLGHRLLDRLRRLQGALNSLTVSLARVLGPEVRVNAVCPATWIRPGSTTRSAWTAQAGGRALLGDGAAQGLCAPEDIAETIVWLIEGRAPVTGETIFVDGGMHITAARDEWRAGTVRLHHVGAGFRGHASWRTPHCGRTHTVLRLESGSARHRSLDPTSRWVTASCSPVRRQLGHESEPEPNLNGRRIFSPRARCWAVSSTINGLVYILRTSRKDFDAWEVPGWSHVELLLYFKKTQSGSPTYERHELCDAFIASAASLGIPGNDDFNGEQQEGTATTRRRCATARRSSTAVEYLRRR
jgi:hypothetical protein